jgi:hypothetical protein
MENLNQKAWPIFGQERRHASQPEELQQRANHRKSPMPTRKSPRASLIIQLREQTHRWNE